MKIHLEQIKTNLKNHGKNSGFVKYMWWTRFRTKHHAIQYEPIMTPGNEHLLHHMEVFLCVPDDKDANFPIWSGEPLVFCYQNCSDLLWEKIVLVIEKKNRYEAEGWEFPKILRSLEQFVQTVKGQNSFW